MVCFVFTKMSSSFGLFSFVALILVLGSAHFFILVNAKGYINDVNRAHTNKMDWDETNGERTKNGLHEYRHPLDPLTELEINMTSSIIRDFARHNWIFIYIGLKEPEKSALLPYFLNNTSPPINIISRKSFSLLLDQSRNQGYEVVVNLNRRRVESWGASASKISTAFTIEQALEAEKILREDEQVVERCRKLGWTDMSLVTANSWPVGYVEDREEYRKKRLVQMFLYGKIFENDNQYAHPFDFLPVIDLNEGRVIAIEDLPTHDDFDVSNKTGNSVPRTPANYIPELRNMSSFRQDLRPVKMSQPNGTSFKVTGNEIEWQKFQMRIGFNGREGLVIYNVKYNDGGYVRPLFYRMSLAEIFVPYGDPRPPYHRKAGFDEGQFGLGFGVNELQPQIDCIGQVEFFDFALHNEKGEAIQKQRAVCLHEEDTGVLWKHTDFRTGKSAVVRSQRLVMTFSITVGNYDYIYTWYFYQDATIQFHVKLTGILSLSLLAINATSAGHETIVSPQITAQYHQHFFSLRLDAEIDGNENSVVVQDVVPVEAPTGSKKNPYGQGINTQKTLLKTAGQGRTRISVKKSRTWHITNPNAVHPSTKQPVGWKLMPWPTPPLLLRRDSPLHSKVEWLDYNTWVTPYKENQLFSGGFYLNNSGLSEWVRQDANANIDNTDIVLWYNFGITHIPRVEDFPVMPAEVCGVTLKPVNFFKQNPALDVPPPMAGF